MFVSRIIWKKILYYFSSTFFSGLFKYKVLRYNTVRISNDSQVKASSSVRNNASVNSSCDLRSFDSHAIFGLPLLPLSSSAPTPPRRCWAARPYSHWHTQFLFCFGRRQTDIFVIICSDFQEALSLLVYRNLWYMDAQVCFLRVLFKSWIDHFFQISTEISLDGRLKTLITFRVINLFDASRVASIFRLI